MAARSLGRLGREDAVAPLVELRTEPPTSKARSALAYSLERLGAPEELGEDRRIHPYVFYGVGPLFVAMRVWLAQARDGGTPGSAHRRSGDRLLVGRVQVIRQATIEPVGRGRRLLSCP